MTETKVHQLPRLGMAGAMRIYGLTARALRHYEDKGLLEARRNRLNARFYDADARRRLDWIVPLRSAGVSVGDIREVLRAEEEDGRRQEFALRAIARRQAALEAQLAEARDALQTCKVLRPATPHRAVALVRGEVEALSGDSSRPGRMAGDVAR